jgi:hypothetical protein
MEDLSNIYCGIGKARKGKKAGTFLQCLKKGKVSRFGKFGAYEVEEERDAENNLIQSLQMARDELDNYLKGVTEKKKNRDKKYREANKDVINERRRLKRKTAKTKLNEIINNIEIVENLQVPDNVKKEAIAELIDDAAQMVEDVTQQGSIKDLVAAVYNEPELMKEVENKDKIIKRVGKTTNYKCSVCGSKFVKKLTEQQFLKHVESKKHQDALKSKKKT